MTKTTESGLFLFSPPIQACYSLSSAPTIVLKVYANELVILCKSGNAALEASTFRAIPGSGIFIYSFNIKLTAFYN